MPIRIAIIGYGKIARDQHVPSIRANPEFELVAVSSRRPVEAGVPAFTDHREMMRALDGKLDAVVLATPPTVRRDIAAGAFGAGLHVLLEKPPAATLGETDEIERMAREAGRTLYAGWHSQHAPGVEAARRMLEGKAIRSCRILWHEDVRKWHPGQEWIWAPGGFGVFDPGINALSIATRILPIPLIVRDAALSFPENRQTPVAARLTFAGEEGAFSADFDWRYSQGEKWTIALETADGAMMELLDGGARLTMDGAPQPVDERGEYPGIYARFAELIREGRSEVDREPLRIVADAFLVGSRENVEAFL